VGLVWPVGYFRSVTSGGAVEIRDSTGSVLLSQGEVLTFAGGLIIDVDGLPHAQELDGFFGVSSIS
jgi:hypothetical protein